MIQVNSNSAVAETVSCLTVGIMLAKQGSVGTHYTRDEMLVSTLKYRGFVVEFADSSCEEK